jgi:hypothetical protein
VKSEDYGDVFTAYRDGVIKTQTTYGDGTVRTTYKDGTVETVRDYRPLHKSYWATLKRRGHRPNVPSLRWYLAYVSLCAALTAGLYVLAQLMQGYTPLVWAVHTVLIGVLAWTLRRWL